MMLLVYKMKHYEFIPKYFYKFQLKIIISDENSDYLYI